MVIIALVVAGVGIYFTRISSETRIFRMAGQKVGPYQGGRVLLAEKIKEPSILKKGDGVLYAVDQDGRSITRVGMIYGLPGEKNLGEAGDISLDESHFLVGQSENQLEMVEKGAIGWKIVRQF